MGSKEAHKGFFILLWQHVLFYEEVFINEKPSKLLKM